jgi:hypothetical protein
MEFNYKKVKIGNVLMDFGENLHNLGYFYEFLQKFAENSLLNEI